jgi:hypothetical protein
VYSVIQKIISEIETHSNQTSQLGDLTIDGLVVQTRPSCEPRVATHVRHVDGILMALYRFVETLRCSGYVVCPVVYHRRAEVVPSGGSVAHALGFEKGISTGLS